MVEGSSTLHAIRYSPRGAAGGGPATLHVLDQLQLPQRTVYLPVPDTRAGHRAIATMQVRGAPAIAIVAILSLAVELDALLLGRAGEPGSASDATTTPTTVPELMQWVTERLDHLLTSRPTAVNLAEAAGRLQGLLHAHVQQGTATLASVHRLVAEQAEAMLHQDLQDNRAIGRHGVAYLSATAPPASGGCSPLRVLTHCNTGSLATAGHGTALGVVRSLHAAGLLDHCYCTETRPYNQGSRLTAYELVHDRLPATLVCDSMAAALCATHRISCIIVGADRISANGDTANKIGTFALAIVAAHHGIPFLVAAPTTTIDLHCATGAGIPIEQRAPEQVTTLSGQLLAVDGVPSSSSDAMATIAIAAPGIGVWNPSFDVTPAALISAIVTERGVYVKQAGQGTFHLRDPPSSAASAEASA